MNNRIPKSHIIETDRLLLRIASIDDIPFVFLATKYKGFNDGMLWDAPKNEEELLQHHESVAKKWGEGLIYNFSIINKRQNYLVGRISIRKGLEENCWNIGYWTHPEHQNKGY